MTPSELKKGIETGTWDESLVEIMDACTERQNKLNLYGTLSRAAETLPADLGYKLLKEMRTRIGK